MKRERRRVAGGGDSPRSGDGGGSQSSPQVGTVAEPWVGVDSSKPPRLFASVVALMAGGGLATPERPVGALAGISHILEGLGEDLPKTGKFACPSCAGAVELHAYNLLWRLV